MASRSSFESANERGRRLQTSVPKAISARYDRRRRRVVIGLSSNVEVGFSPLHAQGLEGARPFQLEKMEISPSGLGIHFPRLDADLYLPTILEGFLGSRKWMASTLSQPESHSRLASAGSVDEILPEYDFGRGRPNKYAVRYTPRLLNPLSFTGAPLDSEAPFTLGFSSDNADGVHHGDI